MTLNEIKNITANDKATIHELQSAKMELLKMRDDFTPEFDKAANAFIVSDEYRTEMDALKKQSEASECLASTDYIANKLIEAADDEEETAELREKYAEQIAQRKQWRKDLKEANAVLEHPLRNSDEGKEYARVCAINDEYNDVMKQIDDRLYKATFGDIDPMALAKMPIEQIEKMVLEKNGLKK